MEGQAAIDVTNHSRRSPANVIRWATEGRRRTAVLLLYGLLIAIFGALLLWSDLPDSDEWPMQSGRVARLDLGRQALDAGAPPGIVKNQDPGGKEFVLAGGAAGDDPGLFIYVPVINEALDTSDPRTGVKLLLIALVCLALLYYPLVFHRLTGSFLAALLSPVLLLALIRPMHLGIDLYWILAWAILALVPPLALVPDIRSIRGALALLVPLMLAASFASSIRSHAGLIPLLFALILIVMRADWSLVRRGGVAAAAVVAYLAVSPLLIGAVTSNAVSWAGDRVDESGNNRHVFWHSAYLGLGYLPNEERIYWYDTLAQVRAHEIEPEVEDFGPEYERIMRDLYFDAVSEDPNHLISSTVSKVRIQIFDLPRRELIAAILLVPLLAVSAWGGLMRRFLLFAPAGIVIGFAPGLIGYPLLDVSFAGFATVMLLLLVALLTLAARAAPFLKALADRLLTTPGPLFAGDRFIGGCILSLGALLVWGQDGLVAVALGLLLGSTVLLLRGAVQLTEPERRGLFVVVGVAGLYVALRLTYLLDRAGAAASGLAPPAAVWGVLLVVLLLVTSSVWSDSVGQRSRSRALGLLRARRRYALALAATVALLCLTAWSIATGPGIRARAIAWTPTEAEMEQLTSQLEGYETGLDESGGATGDEGTAGQAEPD
jgi:hypothetical protein